MNRFARMNLFFNRINAMKLGRQYNPSNDVYTVYAYPIPHTEAIVTPSVQRKPQTNNFNFLFNKFSQI